MKTAMITRIGLAVVVVLGLCGSAWAFSGGGAGTEADPYVITTVQQLQEMANDLTVYYELGNDIDAYDTVNWNGGLGFEPIGFDVSYFTGSFDGKKHIVTGLYINRAPDYGIGLFGRIGAAGTVKNVGIVGNNINGRMAVGGLAGHSEGVISDCYATGTASAEADVGGLVGYTNKIVTRCYSSGSVTAGGRTGSFTSIGGLIGITREPDSVISDCYSTADVTSTSAYYQTGGFIGINKDTVNNCYSTGQVTAASGSNRGGFCSMNQGSMSSCYWDTQTSTTSSSSGGTPKTTAEMKQQATFSGWDFVNTWDIEEDVTYPFLRGGITVSIDYQIVDLGTLGGNESRAYAINENGTIVGRSLTGSGETRAFIYESGVMSGIGTLGGSTSEAYGINENGQIVGKSENGSGQIHAFLYDDSNTTMIDLGTLGGVESYAKAINNNGQIACSSQISSGYWRAAIYENGQMTNLGILSGSSWNALTSGINSSGQIVGYCDVTGGSPWHACMWENSTINDLGTLPGTSKSNGQGINDSGQITGFSNNNPSPPCSGFIYESGTMSPIGSLGQSPDDTRARSININGHIVGYSNTTGGNKRAFLYTGSNRI